jgi:hypothetical protein
LSRGALGAANLSAPRPADAVLDDSCPRAELIEGRVRPIAVGVVRGLAGSAAIALLVLSAPLRMARVNAKRGRATG